MGKTVILVVTRVYLLRDLKEERVRWGFGIVRKINRRERKRPRRRFSGDVGTRSRRT